MDVAEISQRQLDVFAQAVPRSVQATYRAWAVLPQRLLEVVQEVGACGDLGLETDRFLAELGGRIPAETSPEEAFARLRAADLAVVLSAAAGHAAAIRLLDRELETQCELAIARVPGVDLDRDDLCQCLREKLLLSIGDREPRILGYLGRGRLSSWLRMVATRHLVDIARKSARRLESAEDDCLASAAAPGDDPELAFLKVTYRDEFRAAFRNALRDLDPGKRTLLRLRYLDELGVEDIARLRGVHRVTISKQLGRIRQDLMAEVRRALVQKLGVTRDEIDSIMALIASRLETSLSALL